MRAALVVFRKELKDALRDRRTWLIVLVSSLVAGPVSLLLLSAFVSSVEEIYSDLGISVNYQYSASEALVNTGVAGRERKRKEGGKESVGGELA